MPGDWMKIEHDTPDKPEVLGIAAQLGIDADAAFGKCFKVWRWFDRHTLDGNAPSVTRALLDAHVNALGFADAMRSVGWLEPTADGLSLPNFDAHNGKTAKGRALTAIRAKKTRTKSNAHSVTNVTPAALRNAHQESESESDTSLAREVKPPTPFPPEIDTEAFRLAWSEWLAYRRERSVKTTPRTTKSQLAMLAALGPAKAIEAIGNSIRGGWQGLFDPGENRSGKPKSTRVGPGQVFDPSQPARNPVGDFGD